MCQKPLDKCMLKRSTQGLEGPTAGSRGSQGEPVLSAVCRVLGSSAPGKGHGHKDGGAVARPMGVASFQFSLHAHITKV